MNSQEMQSNPRVAEIGKLMRKDLYNESDEHTRLKLKINNLLWEELPKERTIGQADAIACEVFRMITGIG